MRGSHSGQIFEKLNSLFFILLDLQTSIFIYLKTYFVCWHTAQMS